QKERTCPENQSTFFGYAFAYTEACDENSRKIDDDRRQNIAVPVNRCRETHQSECGGRARKITLLQFIHFRPSSHDQSGSNGQSRTDWDQPLQPVNAEIATAPPYFAKSPEIVTCGKRCKAKAGNRSAEFGHHSASAMKFPDCPSGKSRRRKCDQ